MSVSLPAPDVEFIDSYAVEHAVVSRSAVLQRALALLRANQLGDAYLAAWTEWDVAEADGWEALAADGLSGATG